ncbi:MAG: hypothetical protein ABIJ27_08440 [Candidatus Omnitrophota bacterium]
MRTGKTCLTAAALLLLACTASVVPNGAGEVYYQDPDQDERNKSVLEGLPGSWIEKAPRRINYFSVVNDGESALWIAYLRSEHASKYVTTIPLKEISVSVDRDLFLKGTATYWMDFKPYHQAVLPPKEVPIVGRISHDGSRIVLEEERPKFTVGRWTGESEYTVTVLERHHE